MLSLLTISARPQTSGSVHMRFGLLASAPRLLACAPNLHSIKVGKLYNHVDDTERRLVKNMISAGIPWSKVQKVTGRSSDTIHSIVCSFTCIPAVAAAALPMRTYSAYNPKDSNDQDSTDTVTQITVCRAGQATAVCSSCHRMHEMHAA